METEKGISATFKNVSQPVEPQETATTEPCEYLLEYDSDEQPVVSVVMPTLNEERGVAECIGRIKTALDDLGVTGEIIISDSSTDRTPEIAAANGAHVVTPDKDGYGYAYQYAFERARGEYIAIGDADTTYDFEELPKLYELVASGEADMAMGSRLDGEIKAGSMPALHQYVGNPLLTRFLNAFYDAGVSDAHSGMRVISREALDALDCETTGMEFASEMIMEAGASGLTIAEEPITYHEREGEATLSSFRDGWRHVRFMLVNAPGYLFSLPGVVLGVLGVAMMGLVAGNVQVNGVFLGVHSMVLGSLLTIVGYQVTTLGVFATVASDPVSAADDYVSGWIRRHLRLGRGATAGLVLVAAGTVYGLSLLGKWAATGFTELPFVIEDMIAFTAVVLGLQTLFSAFFMSTIAES
ncbi:glycosyl transferase family 2 [Halococcus salifodinae DSM 8989]|uniref:Glycosyl transferase family 2 n=2 Tax=Halococcus salifodinae TaxID=36738 RepID=M0N1H2_9EURY|nr:glycosyl transferase family 2 [Halococcus salifodinae DSM 8989]